MEVGGETEVAQTSKVQSYRRSQLGDTSHDECAREVMPGRFDSGADASSDKSRHDYEIRSLDADEFTRWDDFVRRSPQG